jgi:CDGSH-type Zn-finger protein
MSTQIQPLANGPLKVDGDFKVLLPDGSVAETKETAYLCRCGHSGKKPFCDGAHKAQGFKAD